MSRTRDILSNAGTVVLVLCAVAVTAVVLKREFSPGGGGVARAAFAPVAGWERLASTGHALGRDDAPVKVVVFSDFQCPFCASAVASIDSLQTESGDRVSVVFRHFPIESIHPHAFAAALATECAGEQGRFEAYHDALFAGQRQIGSRGWRDFGQEAGVPDLDALERCVEEERFAGRIRADMAAAEEAGVTGTPSFVYDGRLGVGGPGLSTLGERALKDARR